MPPGPYGGQQGNGRQPDISGALGNAFPERQGNGGRAGAFGEIQGNAENPAAFGERAADRHQDVSDPAKRGDPPWRGRTARRSSSPAAVLAIRAARLRHGWSITRAAEHAGISRPHMSLLENGFRRPSASVADAVAQALAMTPAEAAALRSVAVDLAGRDSPYREGWRPPPPPHNQQGDTVLGPRRTAPQARQETPETPQAAPSWSAAYDPGEDAQDGDANPWTAVYAATPGAETRQRLQALRASPWRR